MFSRQLRYVIVAGLLCTPVWAQQKAVPLQVGSGTPLRLYLTQRVWFKNGAAVHAKFAEPVWAFDRIVIPAGTAVNGRIAALDPVPRMQRIMAMVRGDFTPLKRAEVRFTSMSLPNGQSLAVDTIPSLGLASIYLPPRPGKKTKHRAAKPAPSNPNSKRARLRQFLTQQAQSQANARSGGFLDFVRGPNKREWLENYCWSKLPYHPQWYRSGTRFDAVLEKPLGFGDITLDAKELNGLGSAAPSNSQALVRLTSTVTSADARPGDALTGVLSQPLFSADRHLLLPEGTRLIGKVTLARSARMFHRGGQLRFAFERAEVPALVAAAQPLRAERAEAQLTSGEAASGNVKVDSEGTARATESKTRFLRPLIAGLVAAKSMDNDAGKQNASAGANANYSGRALGGFSGFGLFGTLAAYAPRPVGSALGFYGLAWSVYSTVVSRGSEVTFEKNAPIEIRFGPPAR